MRSAETSNLGLVDWPGRSAVPAMTMHMQEAAANSEAAQHGSQSVLPASSDDWQGGAGTGGDSAFCTRHAHRRGIVGHEALCGLCRQAVGILLAECPAAPRL